MRGVSVQDGCNHCGVGMYVREHVQRVHVCVHVFVCTYVHMCVCDDKCVRLCAWVINE